MGKHSKGRYSNGKYSRRRLSRGKHAIEKKEKRRSKGIVKKLMFIIILVILLIFAISEIPILMKNNIEEKNNNNVTNEKEEEIILPTEETADIEIPDQIGGYDVLGVIVIDKIGLQQNILNKTTESSLSLAVTKFYGPQLNEKGNFCITGHNYRNLFIDLRNLEIGDTFYIIDKAQSRKVTYKVYKMYTVYPTELDCLSQSTEGKKEVTLITCNPRRINKAYRKSSRDITSQKK